MSRPATAAVFDTSAVIGLIERRSPDLVDLVIEAGRPILRSPTVYGELRHGAAVEDPAPDRRADTLDRYLRLSEWPDGPFELDELARLYGLVSAISAEPELRSGMNDRWIVAECLAYGSDLVTADHRQARLAEAAARAVGATISITNSPASTPAP